MSSVTFCKSAVRINQTVIGSNDWIENKNSDNPSMKSCSTPIKLSEMKFKVVLDRYRYLNKSHQWCSEIVVPSRTFTQRYSPLQTFGILFLRILFVIMFLMLSNHISSACDIVADVRNVSWPKTILWRFYNVLWDANDCMRWSFNLTLNGQEYIIFILLHTFYICRYMCMSNSGKKLITSV